SDETIQKLVADNYHQDNVLALFDQSPPAEKEKSAAALFQTFSRELPVEKAVEFDRALRKSFGLKESAYPASVDLESVRKPLRTAGMTGKKVNELLASADRKKDVLALFEQNRAPAEREAAAASLVKQVASTLSAEKAIEVDGALRRSFALAQSPYP